MMKKTLVALAAAAATGAFAQVSITGAFDLGVNQTDFKGNVVNTVGAQNGTTTSGLSFKANEDLGGGMTTGFQWNVSLDLGNTSGRTSGTTAVSTTSNVTTYLGNGESFVHLSGGFGTFKLGTPDSSSYKATVASNGGFGTSIGSAFRVVAADVVRFQNALRYESPNFGGFTATYHTVAKNSSQSNGDNTAFGTNVHQLNGRDGLTEFGLQFAQGPVAVSYARVEMTQDASSNPVFISESSATASGGTYSASVYTGAGAKYNLDTLGGTYQLGAAKLGLFVQRAYSDTLAKATSSGTTTQKFDRNALGLSVAYDINPSMIARLNVSQVTLNDADTAAGSTFAGKTTTATGLGLDYMLSKRTVVYGRYETNKDEANVRSITGYTALAGSTNYQATMVGIRHSF